MHILPHHHSHYRLPIGLLPTYRGIIFLCCSCLFRCHCHYIFSHRNRYICHDHPCTRCTLIRQPCRYLIFFSQQPSHLNLQRKDLRRFNIMNQVTLPVLHPKVIPKIPHLILYQRIPPVEIPQDLQHPPRLNFHKRTSLSSTI